MKRYTPPRKICEIFGNRTVFGAQRWASRQTWKDNILPAKSGAREATFFRLICNKNSIRSRKLQALFNQEF